MSRKTCPAVERFWEKVSIVEGDGCWEWKAARYSNGYGAFSWPVVDRRERALAHRASYELTYGTIPPGMLVCHHCDNPPCVRPDHLFLGTNSDNMRDASVKGRTLKGDRHPFRMRPELVRARSGDSHPSRLHPESVPRGDQHWSRRMPDRTAKGEQNGTAKLTPQEVREIRELHAAGRSCLSLSRAYHVSSSTIEKIVNRKTWAHVP